MTTPTDPKAANIRKLEKAIRDARVRKYSAIQTGDGYQVSPAMVECDTNADAEIIFKAAKAHLKTLSQPAPSADLSWLDGMKRESPHGKCIDEHLAVHVHNAAIDAVKAEMLRIGVSAPSTQPAVPGEVVDANVPKVIRDGMVAVLYSPGFGAGWSSWASEFEQTALYHPDIVAWVEGGKEGDIDELMKRLTGDGYFYTGGAYDLVIEWLPVGTAFKIHEYDGSESVELKEADVWTIA